MSKLLHFVLMISLFLIIGYVNSLTCTVRSNSCLSDEICLFSMAKLNDSHVANCSYYPYKVCCDRIVSSVLRNGSCSSDEGGVISMYQVNNSHAARKDYYNYKVCAKFIDYPVECSLRNSCYVNETCVVSLYQEIDSHVATCDFPYQNKVCCGKLADSYIDQSSINTNDTTPVVGDVLLFNITVWNLGDINLTNVNVSCYDNGTYFDSDLINISVQTPSYAYCKLLMNCPITHNISFRVDPLNEIREYNETNNEAWIELTLTEKLFITIDSPTNGQNVYRCSPLLLNSTVTASCNPPSGYEVYWYNSTDLIATGEDSVWCIGSSDTLLGTEEINATVLGGGYVNSSGTVNINIINNPPDISEILYNVTPAEIHTSEGIRIKCRVDDNHSYYCGTDFFSCVEDQQSGLNVNISVRIPSPVNEWSNQTANYDSNLRIFYRDYGTTSTSPLGYYKTVCSALDGDDGYTETTSQFLVYQNATISMYLNTTRCWWGDWIKIHGWAVQINGEPVGYANVTVRVGGEVVNRTITNSSGYYEGTFKAPANVGIHLVTVSFVHPKTGKEYGNVTTLTVAPSYGKAEKEMTTAKDVGCYEIPRFIQNPDGSIERVIIKVCVWK